MYCASEDNALNGAMSLFIDIIYEEWVVTFYSLEKLSELYDGYQKAFSVGGKPLLLLQTDGQVHIIENVCPHMDVPLTQAIQLPEQRIRCRAHGIEFELESGKALGPLANTLSCLTRFSPVYEGVSIGVEL